MPEAHKSVAKPVAKPPVTKASESAPAVVLDEPLVFACKSKIAKVAEVIVEGHNCMRNVYVVSFEVVQSDPRIMPNGVIRIESLDVLPFEPGKKYALELSAVE